MQRSSRNRRRFTILFSAALAGAVAMFAMGGVAAAASKAGSTTAKATATLSILDPGVSVQRAGKTTFKPAKNGQRLRVGDKVQTDATGFAQINYTDDSFTRLDVNTTFTIVSLSDDAGNRKIKGSVDSGRTWNRTSALTESETFEQEGAGATAAVVGTAFIVECDTATPQHCTFTSVVDGITLTSIDGEIQLMDPLEECDSTEIVTDVDANLCGDPTQVTLDAILANAWMLENLYIDGVNGFEGIVIVEDGQVISVTPTPPATTETTTTEESTPPETTPDPPVIDNQPVNITYLGSDPTPDEALGPNTHVVSQDEINDVTFMLQVTNPSGGTFWVVFTDLPLPAFGEIRFGGSGVDLVTHYDPTTAVFTFVPQQIEPTCEVSATFANCFDNYPTTVSQGPVTGSVQWSDTFSFVAENAGGGSVASGAVTLVAVDDICTTGTENARPGLPGSIVNCPPP